MHIPKNAIELVDELIGEAEKLKQFYEQLTGQEQLDEAVKKEILYKIEIFKDVAEDFPRKWKGCDDLDVYGIPEILNGIPVFSYSARPIPPDSFHDNDDLVRIPHQLFELYENYIQYLRENKKYESNICEFALEISNMFIRYLTRLKKALIIREKTLVPNDENEISFTYSPDYRSVNLGGQLFTLTSQEAQVIQLLHENFMNGKLAVGLARIINEVAGSESKYTKLKEVFRNDEARETLIKKVKKGIYRLNID